MVYFSKLFCKKLEQLFLPNDSSGDSVDNEASLFRLVLLIVLCLLIMMFFTAALMVTHVMSC